MLLKQPAPWGPRRCFQSKANHLQASRGHSAGRGVAAAPGAVLLSAGERLCIAASGEHPPGNRVSSLEEVGGEQRTLPSDAVRWENSLRDLQKASCRADTGRG